MTISFAEFPDAESIAVAAFLHRDLAIGGLVGRVVVRPIDDRVEAWAVVSAEVFRPSGVLRLSGLNGRYADYTGGESVQLRPRR